MTEPYKSERIGDNLLVYNIKVDAQIIISFCPGVNNYNGVKERSLKKLLKSLGPPFKDPRLPSCATSGIIQ